MGNKDIFNKVRTPPASALKKIAGGRTKGFTDISPMWRIEALTELFGPCGIGWKYEIEAWDCLEGANGETAISMRINLYICIDGKWSEPIPGVGGNKLIIKEANGPYTNDEGFKMALTDAIGVACEALGFGADIYYGANDKPATNENKAHEQAGKQSQKTTRSDPNAKISEAQYKRLYALAGGSKKIVLDLLAEYKYAKGGDICIKDYAAMCEKAKAISGVD